MICTKCSGVGYIVIAVTEETLPAWAYEPEFLYDCPSSCYGCSCHMAQPCGHCTDHCIGENPNYEPYKPNVYPVREVCPQMCYAARQYLESIYNGPDKEFLI